MSSWSFPCFRIPAVAKTRVALLYYHHFLFFFLSRKRGLRFIGFIADTNVGFGSKEKKLDRPLKLITLLVQKICHFLLFFFLFYLSESAGREAVLFVFETGAFCPWSVVFFFSSLLLFLLARRVLERRVCVESRGRNGSMPSTLFFQRFPSPRPSIPSLVFLFFFSFVFLVFGAINVKIRIPRGNMLSEKCEDAVWCRFLAFHISSCLCSRAELF